MPERKAIRGIDHFGITVPAREPSMNNAGGLR
jgi:hypothetical protein